MAEPYSPLLPWAVVASAVIVVLLRNPLSLDWDPFGHSAHTADLWVEPFARLPPVGVDTLLLGNSRFGAMLSATDPTAWLAGCRPDFGRAVGVYPPFFTFGLDQAWVERVRRSDARHVILQLELFLPPADASADPAAKRLTGATAWSTGWGLVTTFQARGADVVVVDLPRCAEERGLGDQPDPAEREAIVARLQAGGVEVLRTGETWPTTAFKDAWHFNELGAARARVWLCDALREGR